MEQNHTNRKNGKGAEQQQETDKPQTSKRSISFPSHVNTYEDEDPNSTVSVYLHAPGKKSVKVNLSSTLSMSSIKQVVQDKIGVQKDRQMLFLNGKNVTQYGNVRLQPQTIIHVRSVDDLCRDSQDLKLNVTLLNFVESNKGQSSKKYTVSSELLVGEFENKLQEELRKGENSLKDQTHFYLLESSRLLEKNKSFADQDVGKQVDIICVITQNQIKTRFSNDTKEQILHDISELLGFDDNSEKKEEKTIQPQRNVRPRYLPAIRTRKIQIPATQEREQQEDPYGLRANHQSSTAVPNFKKKAAPLLKSVSVQLDESPTRSLATKIKSSKTKKDLEILLSSQQKQKICFQPHEMIKEVPKEQKEEDVFQQAKKRQAAAKPKIPPQLPNAMPVVERRKMKLQFDKLFEGGDDSQNISRVAPQGTEVKEQKKPISPPTESYRPPDRLRLSMGARPIFLDQFRLPISKSSKQSCQ